MKKMLIVVVALLLAGCGMARPVLYPNAQVQQVGEAQSQKDIDECTQKAEAYVQDNPAGDVAKTTAAGAVVGTAIGAAVGAITGDFGQGVAIGAASGGISGSGNSCGMFWRIQRSVLPFSAFSWVKITVLSGSFSTCQRSSHPAGTKISTRRSRIGSIPPKRNSS